MIFFPNGKYIYFSVVLLINKKPFPKFQNYTKFILIFSVHIIWFVILSPEISCWTMLYTIHRWVTHKACQTWLHQYGNTARWGGLLLVFCWSDGIQHVCHHSQRWIYGPFIGKESCFSFCISEIFWPIAPTIYHSVKISYV